MVGTSCWSMLLPPSADRLLGVKDYGSVPCLDLSPGPLKTHPPQGDQKTGMSSSCVQCLRRRGREGGKHHFVQRWLGESGSRSDAWGGGCGKQRLRENGRIRSSVFHNPLLIHHSHQCRYHYEKSRSESIILIIAMEKSSLESII